MYKDEKHLFEIIVKEGPMAIAVIEQPGNLRFVNDKFANMLGYSVDELQDKTFQEITHCDDIEKDIKLYEKLNNGEISNYSIEKRYLHKDGNIIWINLHVSLASDDKKFSLAMIYNINDMKQERLRLTDSTAQLEEAIRQGDLGLWVWDPATDLLFWNKCMFDLYGIDVKNFEGKGSKDFFDNLHSEDKNRIINMLNNNVLLNNEPYYAEFRIIRKDNQEIRHVLARGGRFYSQSENRWFILGTNIDITSIKKTEESLVKSNEELLHFAFATSHDLKEPIRAIKGFSKLAKEKLAENGCLEKSYEYITKIESNANRMNIMIEDLLSFAKSGDSKIVINHFELSILAKELDEMMHQAFSNVEFEISYKNLPIIKSSRDHINIVLSNLLTNSIKYRSGKPSKIIIDCENHKKNYLISVRDNGMGIEEGNVGKIFDSFFRAAPASKEPGTGLGLAICKRIISRLGGKIWAKSKINEGTTVFFTIPKDISFDDKE